MPWRPLPEQRRPRPVGESLDRLAGSLGAGRAATLTTVFSTWSDLVGEGVAAHARPRDMRDGVLVVEVDQPAWATQLRFLEAQLLARLAEAVGDDAPRSLEVRVGRPEGGGAGDGEGRTERSPEGPSTAGRRDRRTRRKRPPPG